VGNYGLYWDFWDRLMGTDAAYRKFEAEGGYEAVKQKHAVSEELRSEGKMQ
jgi:hypothetical protein